MKTKNYTQFVEDFWNQTPNNRGPVDRLDLAVAGLGLAGESGEALEYLKKYCAGRHPELKVDELFDELGDVLYYLTRILSYTGKDLKDLMEYNIKKLGTRFNEDVSEYLA